jgi:hypothetical protein
MKRAIVVVLVLFGVLVNSAFAQKPAVVLSQEPGWHKIGEVTASFKMQNESITVLGADEFTAIKLRVTDAPINIERLQVFYEDGESEEVDLRNELAAGSETRVIDLKGSNKELSKVAFTYKTLPNYEGDKADVELYGYKAQRDGESNAYRDEDKDGVDDNEINEEARETKQEIKEESREARQEIKEESREAKQEIKEERREAERDAERAEEKTEEGADKVGEDISEAAGNVGAEIKDKPYVDKVGPDGQRIYMDRHSKYYYISDDGKKIFITKAQMKDNPKKD